MADPLPISLKAWPAPDKTAESLPYLIAQINEQKGSFRNITEASLEEEVRAAETGESQGTDDTVTKEAAEEGQYAEAKGDEVASARDEIIKQVGYVGKETGCVTEAAIDVRPEQLIRRAPMPSTSSPSYFRNMLRKPPKPPSAPTSNRPFHWAHWVRRLCRNPRNQKQRKPLQK